MQLQVCLTTHYSQVTLLYDSICFLVMYVSRVWAFLIFCHSDHDACWYFMHYIIFCVGEPKGLVWAFVYKRHSVLHHMVLWLKLTPNSSMCYYISVDCLIDLCWLHTRPTCAVARTHTHTHACMHTHAQNAGCYHLRSCK